MKLASAQQAVCRNNAKQLVAQLVALAESKLSPPAELSSPQGTKPEAFASLDIACQWLALSYCCNVMHTATGRSLTAAGFSTGALAQICVKLLYTSTLRALNLACLHIWRPEASQVEGGATRSASSALGALR